MWVEDNMYICVITRLVSTHFSKGILMNRLLSDCTSCFRPGGGDDKNRQGPVQIQICHFVNRDTHSRQIKIVKINQKTKAQSESNGLRHTCDTLPSLLFVLFGIAWEHSIFVFHVRKVGFPDDYAAIFTSWTQNCQIIHICEISRINY